MPCALLTLASEEVRGEAFLPGRQVPGNYFRAVFTKARNTDNKLLTVAAVNHSFLMGNQRRTKSPVAQCTMSSVSLFFWLFIQSPTCTEWTMKGKIADHSQPVTCSFCCCYVICMCYTSFASQQEKFRARTLRATTAAPPHAVLRERLLCVNLAAEMGVCSDVNAISPSFTIVFHLMHIVTCFIRCRRAFWSEQELHENHRGFHNLILRQMTYSSLSLLFLPLQIL